MKCTDARGAILDADPAILQGLGDDPLATHIRACPSCARRAQAILREEAALSGALLRATRPPDLDRILREVAEPGRHLEAGRRRWLMTGGGKRWGTALFPLAAAAVLAFLFLGRQPTLPGTPYRPSPPPAGLDVQAPPETNVAVLETKDPNITVLWLF